MQGRSLHHDKVLDKVTRFALYGFFRKTRRVKNGTVPKTVRKLTNINLSQMMGKHH